jgi:hypothetical protein
MTGSRRTVSGSYARAVERRWARLCDRAVILSERDWALIEDWHRRGIPVQIIQEAMDAAEARRGKSRRAPRPPRGLAYVAPAVEEAWRTVLDGRIAKGGTPLPAGEPPPGGVQAWRRRLETEPGDSPLHRLLAALLEALDSGEAADAIDARLEREIVGAAPGPLRQRAEDEVGRELEPYVGRMTDDTLEATRRRAVARRLREWLALPGLQRDHES